LSIEPFVAANEEINVWNNEVSFITTKHRTKESKKGVTNCTVVERLAGEVVMVAATKIIYQSCWEGRTKGRVNLRIQWFLTRYYPCITAKSLNL
jgi:hypothetical protein